MSSGGPPPPDFQGQAREQANIQNDLLRQQTQQNRPNQTNAFGVSSTYGTGPDGRPTQQTSFAGALGGASNALQNQAAEMYHSPFSLNGLQPVGSGEDARNEAINSAYGQATSRLDPQWQHQTRRSVAGSSTKDSSPAPPPTIGRCGRRASRRTTPTPAPCPAPSSRAPRG
jgi:hypothetical protein